MAIHAKTIVEPYAFHLPTSNNMSMISFLPIIIYIVILKSLDSFKLVRWKGLCLGVILGIACCAAAYGVSDIAAYLNISYYSPLAEELLKALAAMLLMRVIHIVFFAEALCYGAAVGAGFALLENIVYLAYNPSMLPTTALFRGIGTAMLHIGCTALFLTLLLLLPSLLSIHRRVVVGASDIYKPTTFFPLPIKEGWKLVAVVPSFFIHALYNIQYFSPLVQMLFVVVLFLIIFLLINNYNERRITRWMEQSIVYDVELLTAIRAGKLADTKAGEYLLAVKAQFDAEVFFDMICYIQLYLELTISAKSRIMLREAGLPSAESNEERERRRSMTREFHILRSNIGTMGEIVLRPIVRLTREDQKVFDDQ